MESSPVEESEVRRRRLSVPRFRIVQRLSRLGLPDYTVFTILSIITGAVAGIAAVLFHETVHRLTEVFFHHLGGLLSRGIPFYVVFIPAVGMLLQSLMIRLAPITARKRGVLEVIKAVALRGGHIPFRTTLFHFLAPAICIGSGGTVGPEGPVAQVGGGVASKMGSLFGLGDSRRRIFTAAGSGAAIAAVFNTPLGGIFFALEVILLQDFRTPTFSALILASVTASAISRIFLGNTPTFLFPSVDIGPYYQLYLYAILGLGAGGISLLYIRYSEHLYHLFRRHVLARIPQWLVMTLVGLAVGVCGYFYPQIFGIGYQAINRILAQELTWQVVAVLLVMKFILVPLILHSGGFGGIFAPSLFMGACFGFLYATGLNELLGLSVDVTTFVLVAMGAVLGGINSIPISAILILFEMSRDYALILPLMLAVVISTTLVQLVIKGSIYSVHLSEQGYHIARGHEAAVLRSIQVKSVMREDVALIPEHLPLPQLIRELIESPHSTFYVVNREGRLSGIITESELRPIITEYENLRAMLVAGDIARPDVVTVREDDDLDHVLKLFGQENVDEFPVVSSDNPDKVIGSIWRQDVIAAYNRESLKYNLADELAHDLKALRKAQTVPVADGYSIIERPVPKRFVGKTLAELRLRNKYGLEVLMIRHGSPLFSEEDEEGDFVIPTAGYVLREGDRLVLFGKDEAIAGAKRWR